MEDKVKDAFEEEIQAAIEEEKAEKETLPEAPASLNVKFWIEDYGVMLTMRGTKVSTLVEQLEKIITIAKEKGWKPTWAKDNGQIPLKTVPPFESGSVGTLPPACPVHKTPMTWKPAGISKTTNRPYPGFFACGVRQEDGNWCNAKPVDPF